VLAVKSVAFDCPHCLTRKAGFQGEHFNRRHPDQNEYIVVYQCQVCGNCIVVLYTSVGEGNFKNWMINSAAGNAQFVAMWPKGGEPSVPEHLPDNIKSFYLQGMRNMQTNFDAAGTMFRKALDTTLKNIDPNGKGQLYQRIESLPAAIGVTPVMKEWAHEIRDLGNDAAHEEEPFTEEEVKVLQQFTELFLTYTFTLPEKVKARKASAAAAL
jgi:hypothetical protein